MKGQWVTGGGGAEELTKGGREEGRRKGSDTKQRQRANCVEVFQRGRLSTGAYVWSEWEWDLLQWWIDKNTIIKTRRATVVGVEKQRKQ